MELHKEQSHRKWGDFQNELLEKYEMNYDKIVVKEKKIF